MEQFFFLLLFINIETGKPSLGRAKKFFFKESERHKRPKKKIANISEDEANDNNNTQKRNDSMYASE